MSSGWLRGAAALAALCCALVASACSKPDKPAVLGDPNGSPSSHATASAPPGPRTIKVGSLTIILPPAGDPQTEAVFTGYQAFWVALLGALAKANASESTLSATTTGDAQRVFVNNLTNLRLSRRTQSGPTALHPTVPSVNGSMASLIDCADLSQLRIRNRSGRPVNPPDPKTTQIQVGLVLQGGKWLVRIYDETVRGCRPGA